jgi:hypothetical protein
MWRIYHLTSNQDYRLKDKANVSRSQISITLNSLFLKTVKQRNEIDRESFKGKNNSISIEDFIKVMKEERKLYRETKLGSEKERKVFRKGSRLQQQD